MLWYKAWLETRSRFLAGLVLLTIMAAGTVFDYPQVVKLLPLAETIDTSSATGRAIRASADLSREYRGHVWLHWFRQNLAQMGTLFAVLLASGGLLSHTAGTLFTLSLPVSRTRLLGTRAAMGLAELLVLAIVPSLLIPMLSPAIGQTYSLTGVVIHGVCLFVVAGIFFSLAFLLSTMFHDLWRPMLIACTVAVVLAACELVVPGLADHGVFRVMSAETYFRGEGLPWLGLLASLAASAAMLYAAAANVARLDV